ncbi:MAG: hypothetical protein AAF649_00885 [Verrucomicrobiota bacterium]
MKILFTLILLLFKSSWVLTAQTYSEQLPIRIYTPTGWMLEVRPNGSGTLIWQQEPFPSATARPYTFNYLMLIEELKSRPEGDSRYHYAIGTAQSVNKITAPKDSPFLFKALFKAARILYSENTEGFYRARITNPIFTDQQRTDRKP